MKQKTKKWYYLPLWGIKGALLLCMSLSCQKDPDPSCPKGTCCGELRDEMTYLKTISNAKAALDRNDNFVVENDSLKAFGICFKQRADFANYENSVFANGQINYIYRIWGRVYECRKCPTLTVGYMHFIIIDKIEKIN